LSEILSFEPRVSGNECAIIGETVVKASLCRFDKRNDRVQHPSVPAFASSKSSLATQTRTEESRGSGANRARCNRRAIRPHPRQLLDQVRAEAKVITDVIPVGELHSRRRVSRSLTTMTTTMNVDARRGSARLLVSYLARGYMSIG